MAPSSKRSQHRSRASRDMRQDPTPAEQSSPSRPAKRRRKDKVEQDTPEDEAAASSTAAEPAAPDVNDDDSNDDQIVSQVAQHLTIPAGEPVNASKDHANAIHEANKEGVKAYAKISAYNWTFYVSSLTVNIGRHHDGIKPDDEEQRIHIDLGPSKMVSRHHARIHFDSKTEKWFITVTGRNGIRIDGELFKQNQSHCLTSGEVVEIGLTEMMFVLPSEISPLTISREYLERAGLSAAESSTVKAMSSAQRLPLSAPEAGPPESPSRARASRSQQQQPPQPGQQPIAPAPPDYKRPGTPPSVRARAPKSSQLKSPHNVAAGTMLMTPNDVDLSLDDNKHIKPPYSYSQLITQAISQGEDQKLTLNGIYTYIINKYAYYRHQPANGWQNSIRHNLSLNKGFEKLARSTQEPGKGMKWHIVDEQREEMVRVCYKGGRGGHRGSSQPSSPNTFNSINPGPRDVGPREPPSARKRKLSNAASPSPGSAMQSQFTPDRTSRSFPAQSQSTIVDGSPLPRPRKSLVAANPSDNTPRSPTLGSSFNPEDNFVTPAPQRLRPRLAPPSTAQRPSQHMPTSSPAPFWKYADIGSTPLKPAQLDLSPSKPSFSFASGGPLGQRPPPGSSPPPAAGGDRTPVGSPTRKKVTLQEPTPIKPMGTAPPSMEGAPTLAPPSSQAAATSAPAPAPVRNLLPPPNPMGQKLDAPEDVGFDLTKGFQSIGSYHTPSGGPPPTPAGAGRSL